MDSEIVLCDEIDGEDGWIPRISLEHDAELHEMYVILGEEASSMVEHVSSWAFEAIRRQYALVILDAYDHIPNKALLFPNEEMAWDYYETELDGYMVAVVPIERPT